MAQLHTIGLWAPDTEQPCFDAQDLCAAVERVREPVFVVQDPQSGRVGVAFSGRAVTETGAVAGYPLLAALAATYPEWLGDRSFQEVHGVRFPYIAGAMANGIATTTMVAAMARAGFIGFFGAAGLALHEVEAAVATLSNELGREGWGSNLIHSPHQPELEQAIADLYIRQDVRRVSAAAFMELTPAIVRYAASGLYCDARGRIHRRHHVLAKISRPEVARRFMQPAPAEMLEALLAAGKLTPEQVRLAREVAVAEDLTVEADSGGHTDNQALTALLPTVLSLRDEIAHAHGYTRPIRVGAAGGLGTPGAVAAAFTLGAAYVLTGSVNQACVESGLHEDGRRLLAEADVADVVMAPAADMFELGVQVQVLKRGTLFGVRAKKLYDLYRACSSLDSIAGDERAALESLLGQSLTAAWTETQAYWQAHDPREVDRASTDPKHKMALLFRLYLGRSSRWAIAGDPARRMDFQIWCGPAMGAFNAWTRGSFLEQPEHRSVVQVARNLMEGATVVTRAQQLRSFGVAIPSAAFDYRPRRLE